MSSMLRPVDHRAMPMMRRTFLAQALAGAGLLMLRPTVGLCASAILIPNITGMYAVEVARVAVPMSTADVAREVRS